MEKLKSISLTLTKPKRTEKWFTQQWKEMLTPVRESDDIPYLVFFGEVLKILDHTGNIFFESSCYDQSSVYGPYHEWKLKTENLIISRDHKETLSDSWQSIEVISNSFITEGFSPDFYVDWNGKFLGGIQITFGGISGEDEELIRDAAENIFENPIYETSDYSEDKKRESDLRREQLFLN